MKIIYKGMTVPIIEGSGYFLFEVSELYGMFQENPKLTAEVVKYITEHDAILKHASIIAEDPVKYMTGYRFTPEERLSICEAITKDDIAMQIAGEHVYQVISQIYQQKQREQEEKVRRERLNIQKTVKQHHCIIRRKEFQGSRSALMLALIERDSYACKYCGSQKNIAIDHIVPLSKGGTDDLDNLQLLCGSCNSKKSDKI